MNISVDPGMLDVAIREELQDWADVDLKHAINESVKETASQIAKDLKKPGPYSNRTGKYAKDWSSKNVSTKLEKATGTEVYTVYNKKNYRLTHLLEYGHQSRNGGRVKAYPHIAKAEEKGAKLVVAKLEQKLQ